jgi:hypothetical protein
MSKQLPPELRPNLPPPGRATMIEQAREVLDDLAANGCQDAWLLLRCEPDDGMDLTGTFRTLRHARSFVVASLSILKMTAEKEGSQRDVAIADTVLKFLGATDYGFYGGLSEEP